MWIALVLPLLVLPALVGFSRFEQRMLTAPGTAGSSGAATATSDVARPAAAPRA